MCFSVHFNETQGLESWGEAFFGCEMMRGPANRGKDFLWK